MKDQITAFVDLYQEVIDAEITEAEAERRDKGCVDIVQMCSLVKVPDDIPINVQQHIANCCHCRPLYEEFLKTYPDLERPTWLTVSAESPTNSALVKRQTTALARQKDVATTNFRPWYLDHEGNDIRPWYMRWLDNLKDLPRDIFHTDREHRQ